MRIIGGTSAGAIIKVPKGLGVRPTPDKVRLAIFNSLAGFAEDARVLEVFAGTGALGLECLSRGAASAMFVELSAKHARIMQANARAIGVPLGQAQFKTMDAFVAIRQLSGNGAKFDLILADPPYGDKNVNKRSESFAQQMLDDENLPVLWEQKKMLKHGDTHIEILRLAKG
jgi:16S rRNA (guanine966-N2)-methyltransferase